jgi:hypothetical protein
MSCWPSTVVGAFFLALLLFDMVTNDWKDLPFHAAIGVVITGVITLICMFVSETIAGVILVVPVFFLVTFFIALWFSGESLKRRGCCVTCGPTAAEAAIANSDNENTLRYVPRSGEVKDTEESTITTTTTTITESEKAKTRRYNWWGSFFFWIPSFGFSKANSTTPISTTTAPPALCLAQLNATPSA